MLSTMPHIVLPEDNIVEVENIVQNPEAYAYTDDESFGSYIDDDRLDTNINF